MTALSWNMEGSSGRAFEAGFRVNRTGREDTMNFYDKKTRKIISTVIITIVILAMVIPLLSYAL